MTNLNLASVYKKAIQLSEEEQLALIYQIAGNLKRQKLNKGHKLSELKGLGKEIWQNTDVQQYIKNIRQEWNGR